MSKATELRKTNNKKAFDEGHQACIEGRHKQTNPYHGSTLFVHWANGWEQASIDLDEAAV